MTKFQYGNSAERDNGKQAFPSAQLPTVKNNFRKNASVIQIKNLKVQ